MRTQQGHSSGKMLLGLEQRKRLGTYWENIAQKRFDIPAGKYSFEVLMCKLLQNKCGASVS